jgi:hypothetical protein
LFSGGLGYIHTAGHRGVTGGAQTQPLVLVAQARYAPAVSQSPLCGAVLRVVKSKSFLTSEIQQIKKLVYQV